MSAAARPFVLVSTATLRSIESHAQQALQAWAREWAPGCEPLVRAVQLESAVPDGSFLKWDGSHGSVWIRHWHNDTLDVGATVLGPEFLSDGECVDPWIENAILRARAARDDAIASAMTGGRCDARGGHVRLPPGVCAPGSGAVELTCADLGLQAVIDGAASLRFAVPAAPARPLPPVSPLPAALADVRLNLVARLGEVTLELGKLATLAPGDVLRLPKRLSDPVAVLCEGKPLATAALGESTGRKAIQILAADS